ncbi:MAG: HlyD family type I secretion periplasmic adaptor subunit [Pseudomonadota bacterium]
MTRNTETETRTLVGRTKGAIAIGLTGCVLLVGGAGIWSTTAKLSSAVVTSGQVVVASETKVVQHPDGGVVGQINVANGDHVTAGDVVLTLDDALLRKNRDLIDGQLIALEAQRDRLEAERDGADTITPTEDIAARREEPAVQQAMDLQARVLAVGAASRAGQVATYEHQIAQLQDQITGLETERDAKSTSIDLVQDELNDVEPLFDKGIVQKTRITSLKRERSELEGARGSLISQIAVAKGQIAEIRQLIAQIDTTFHQETVASIEAVTPQIAQLKEQLGSLDLQLSRVEIRAPSDGVVNQLAVHTLGGVIQPGETVMQIVPVADNLVVQARVLPKDINHVGLGQDAKLVVSAFDPNTTPEIHGTVSYISADLTSDARQEMAFYDVRITLDDAKDAGIPLAFLPGMQAEVFISAGERTLMAYMLEPMQKRLSHTFREV